MKVNKVLKKIRERVEEFLVPEKFSFVLVYLILVLLALMEVRTHPSLVNNLYGKVDLIISSLSGALHT